MGRRVSRSATTLHRRRLAALMVLKLVAIAVALFVTYFLLPLDHLSRVPLGLTMGVGLVLLGVVSWWQVLAVVDAEQPSLRAIEALAGIIPLFLILFASSYYVLELVQPGSFNDPLTRGDALYFTVTVLSTVGFGDITAASGVARGAVTFQMILNIVILGLGVRVLTRAVQIGQERHRPGPGPDDNEER